MSDPPTPSRPRSAPSQRFAGAAARPPTPPPGGLTTREVERATGASTVDGNRIRLQFEGAATFDAWIEAIEAARRFVYFENYVIRDDRVGRRFRDALVAKALEGVPVFMLYDWLGCWATPRRYWKPMRDAGVQIRAFNPPSGVFTNPFGVLQRDHRKLVVVDGDLAFVGGFCIGEEWAGTPERAPWRDTGVEIRGPAAHVAALAFERLWGAIGMPSFLAATLAPSEPCGETPVWVIEGEPGRARVYRSLHLAAARARERIWITDAYFVAPRSVSEALAAAAGHGVDVRIIVPANNNWPLVGAISRGGYRFLLEHGVRLYEWQGPMMHAKTAVVDGRWCRVGSSNLNAASLMGNWELDVGVLDTDLATQLEALFLADLASAVEIVLPGARSRVRAPWRGLTGEPPLEPLEPEGSLPQRLQRIRDLSTGAARLRIAPFVRAGATLGDALAGNRQLGREDRAVVGTLAIAVLLFAVVAALFPAAVGWTVAVLAGWFGVLTGIRAWEQARRERREARELKRLDGQESETST